MVSTRGTLLLAAVAVSAVAPFAARADVAAQGGQLLDFENYASEPQWQTSFVNTFMCGSATLQLEWNLGQTPPTNATSYQLFASNKPPTATGTGMVLCATQNDPTASPPTRAGLIASGTQTVAIGRNTVVRGFDALSAAGLTCEAGSEMQVLYICAHLLSGATPVLSATGRFVVQLAAPDAPVNVNVFATDPRSLDVSWTPASGGAAPAHHFMVMATAVDSDDLPMPGDEFVNAPVTGTAATLSGLAPDQRYRVVVVAYSIGGSALDASDSAPVFARTAPVGDPEAAPAPASPGSGRGGCGAGGAGPLSLLAATVLARVLRRRE